MEYLNIEDLKNDLEKLQRIRANQLNANINITKKIKKK